MKKTFLMLLLCLVFKTLLAQDTISFPQNITKFVKVDSVNEDTMYKRAFFYFAPHYKIVTNKKGKVSKLLWMTAQLERRNKDSFLLVGKGVIPYFINCNFSNFKGGLECSITIKILPNGFEYTIENVEHKSIDGTFDFGPLVNKIPYPLSHYPSLLPLSPKCWSDMKQGALKGCDLIDKEITEQITTGSITPS